MAIPIGGVNIFYSLNNFSSWDVLDIQVSGINRKFWLEKDGKRGLFKFSNEVYRDYWVEKLASDIFTHLGLKCMEVDVGVYRGNLGSMCYDFVPEVGMFVEMDDHLVKFSGRRRGCYTLAMLNYVNDAETFNNIIYMLVIDYLIGNTDRHTGNFGTLLNGDLAPVYDNGSSLFYRLAVSSIPELYTVRDKFMMNVYRLPQSRCMDNRLNLYANIDLMKLIKHTYSALFNISMGRLSALTESSLQTILAKFVVFKEPKFLSFLYIAIIHRLNTLKELQ